MYRSILSMALVLSGSTFAGPTRTVTNFLHPLTSEVTGEGSVLKSVLPQHNGGVGRLVLGVVVKVGMGTCERFEGVKVIPSQVVVGAEGQNVVPRPLDVQTLEFYSTGANGPLWEGACTAMMKYQEVVVPLSVTWTTMNEPVSTQFRLALGGGKYIASYDFNDGSVKVRPIPVTK